MAISVMIVDDEHLERILITRSFDWQGEGFTIVAEAENGRDALALYTRLHPQLVVTDINMPFMDGLQLSQAIKEQDDSTEITIISGFNEFRYAQRAVNIGVNSFLLKPINPQELAQSARKSRKSIEARAAPSGVPPPATASPMINKVLLYINANFCDYTLSLKTVAANFYLNDCYLSRIFKQHTGANLTEYVTQKRMEKARLLLRETDLKSYEISEVVGINDPHYFAQCFKRQYGQSPTAFRHTEQN